MEQSKYDMQEKCCCMNISLGNLLGLCGDSTHTSSFMYDNNGNPDEIIIDHDLQKDGSQDEKIDLFEHFVELTKKSESTAFIVALHTGGEMGNPRILTEDARLVFATSDTDAERIYNTFTNASYYKGSVIGTVDFK